MSDKSMKWVKLGDYIEFVDVRNYDESLTVDDLRGVTSESIFDNSKASTDGLDFSKYKVVERGDFAYNPSRINLGSIALNDDKPLILSPMYLVFRVKESKKEELIPEYLFTWFMRKEFLRSTLFYAQGSVRDTFGAEQMNLVEIPLLDIDRQRAIANLYRAAKAAKRIALQLDDKFTQLWPVLLRSELNA